MSITPEEQAALEKVRTWLSVYGPNSLPKLDDLAAIVSVAQIALREHPADDDEAITPEWLAKNCKPSELSPAVYGYSIYGPGITLKIEPSPHSCIKWFAIADQDRDSVTLAVVKTRGDVRRLCQALGIELKG